MWNIEGQNSSDPVNPQQATGSSLHEVKVKQCQAKTLKWVIKSSLSIRESQDLFDNMHVNEDQTSDEIMIKTEKNLLTRQNETFDSGIMTRDKIYESSKREGKRLLRF